MKQSLKSSSKVFKEAVALTGKSWVPVFWLIVGQLVLTFAIYYYSMNLIDLEAPLMDVSNSLWRLLEFIVVLLYQIIWTVALVRLLEDPKKNTFANIFGKKLWQKYPAALLLTLVVGIAVIIASFLLVIPGVILGVWWSLAIFVLVLEGKSVLDSLKRSRALVKGWWWEVFTRMVFLITVALVITFVSIVPVYGVFVSYILYLLFTPVVIVYMGLTYKELLAVKNADQSAKSVMEAGSKVLIVLWAIVVLALLSVVSAIADLVILISSNSV